VAGSSLVYLNVKLAFSQYITLPQKHPSDVPSKILSLQFMHQYSTEEKQETKTWMQWQMFNHLLVCRYILFATIWIGWKNATGITLTLGVEEIPLLQFNKFIEVSFQADISFKHCTPLTATCGSIPERQVTQTYISEGA